MKKFILPLALLTVLAPANAYAYLDPGTGSMVLQALLAGVAGLVVLVKMYWHRFTAFFRRSERPLSEQMEKTVYPNSAYPNSGLSVDDAHGALLDDHHVVVTPRKANTK